MKTTYTPDTIVIVGGEISVYSHDKKKLIASTDKTHLQVAGVTQLDRQQFVRPVDERELAAGKASKLDFKGRDYVLFREGFVHGYNANKGVFTEEQINLILDELDEISYTNDSGDELVSTESIRRRFDDLIYSKPISIPQSVTIENGVVIDIVW